MLFFADADAVFAMPRRHAAAIAAASSFSLPLTLIIVDCRVTTAHAADTPTFRIFAGHA